MEAKQDVVHVEGLNQGVLDPNYNRALIARFALAQQMKGILSCLILDKNETWDAKQLSFAGLPEVVDRLVIGVCGAVGIPASRLFGRSSANGLQATTAGHSDDQRYYADLGSQQRTIVTPALRTLDECLIRSALGRRPKNLFYDWNSLWSMPATDQAEIRLKHSQAAKNLADAELVDRDALGKSVISQAEDDGWLPALSQNVAETKQQTDPQQQEE
jgi:phage-related protein (TIGR01555 family)